MEQFKRFCLVGGLGFVIDSICFWLLSLMINELLVIRLLSFWTAATTTWLGNRIYTWQDVACNDPLRQWGRHMLTAHFSGCFNLITFWALLGFTPVWFAFCVGILVGLLSNFYVARHFVFIKTAKSNRLSLTI